MSHAHALQNVLVVLVALIAAGPLFQRLHLGPVMGYLTAGILLGPSALGWVEAGPGIAFLAELGVVFLMFSIGLELKLDRLRLFGRAAYSLAVIQVVGTAAAGAGVGYLFGLSWPAALVAGGALSLSSTAIVLGLMQELGRTTTGLGRMAIATLLVQDLAVAPLLVITQVLAEGGGGLATALGLAAVKSMAVLVVLFFVARWLLGPLLRATASSGLPEAFAGLSLLLILGTGWATESAGLSMALGALLAGLMVADTEFRHQVAADIQPFRGLLLGLFFLTVGMTVDLHLVTTRAGTVFALVGALMVGKALLIGLAVLALGQTWRRALALGGLLGQGSEFAFVLFAMAGAGGLFSPETTQTLTAAVALSMLGTPLVVAIGKRSVEAVAGEKPKALGDLEAAGQAGKGHVVVVSFGQVGKAVARHLVGQRIPTLVLDMNARRVADSRERGLSVFYGNAQRLDVLRAAGLDKARALIVGTPDAEQTEAITALARRTFPNLRIFARSPDDEDTIRALKRAGADAIAPDGLTTAMELAERVMLLTEPD
ncbi:MAG: cation:proton antiporter [Rhodobacterales bacterium]|nr:cation:proton antiporter [Rhodobacterales bacterium]